MPNTWKRWNYLIIKFMSVIMSVKEIKYEKQTKKERKNKALEVCQQKRSQTISGQGVGGALNFRLSRRYSEKIYNF